MDKQIALLIIAFFAGLITLYTYNYCAECGSLGCRYDPNAEKMYKNAQPLMRPEFNMREAAKEMELLERHLHLEGMRCPDCIKKHFLYIEGLCEEAITLDKEGKIIAEIKHLPDVVRSWERSWMNGADPNDVARAIRPVRKQLHTKYFEYFN